MKLTEQQTRALEALESMDDFARMDVGVGPIGPYKVLREFIESHGGFLAALPKPEPVAWMNTNGAFNNMKIAERDALHGAAMEKLTSMIREAQVMASPTPQPDDVRDALRRVASIAHMGGLARMTESDALIAIRRATIQYFDADATKEQHLAAIASAKGEV